MKAFILSLSAAAVLLVGSLVSPSTAEARWGYRGGGFGRGYYGGYNRSYYGGYNAYRPYYGGYGGYGYGGYPGYYSGYGYGYPGYGYGGLRSGVYIY